MIDPNLFALRKLRALKSNSKNTIAFSYLNFTLFTCLETLGFEFFSFIFYFFSFYVFFLKYKTFLLDYLIYVK